MKLLTAAGTGNGASVKKEQALNREIDQFNTYFVWGTFGGATVRLEISPDNVTWFDSGIAATAQSAINVEFRATFVRGVVVGGAAPVIEALLL